MNIKIGNTHFSFTGFGSGSGCLGLVMLAGFIFTVNPGLASELYESEVTGTPLVTSPIEGNIELQSVPPAHHEVEAGLRKALVAMSTRQWAGGWASRWNINGQIVWGQSSPMPYYWVTVQPPSTPETAEIYLRAAKVLNDDIYLHQAHVAQKAILAVQNADGGFPKEGDPNSDRQTGSTFDDDVTTGALDFFIDLWQYTGEESDRQAVLSVGEFLLRSQYSDSGCWPQMYPVRSDHYSRYVTFNDRAMVNAIEALLKLDKLFDDPRYLAAARRGGECIISLQGGPGEEIWGQQHDPETLMPAPARAFEPAGYSAGESNDIIEILIELYLRTGEERFMEPIPKAFAWYEKNRLPNGNWGRIIEPGTGRALHGDREGNVYSLFDENSPEPLPGYVWQRDFYPYDAREAYDRIRETGREAYLAERQKSLPVNLEEMSKSVAEVLNALHPDGWWVNEPRPRDREEMKMAGVPENTWELINSRTFVENAGLLLDYLEAGLTASRK